ncbi:uncharacterized protein LOC110376962 [Helicoverpa armigera]|uniref:Uncharacterized protein n=1 Tax=Helicoverpa armigera TaxID=29058 RepID=A0A2W1BSG1_HELAM|nr:uncharacterized protein LOC110376962 [Helicoverpa armigera]XP_047042387.1 uncharacterized protein LOC124646309 [Helicoverpa zea]PZC77271.1 hypothetical protein B5X24_HaOG203588 [Helicoverpa armigera]
MSDKNDCDITVVLGVLVVFTLPLTLLVPGFSLWDVVPKVRISRLHIVSQDLTWPQLNAAIVSLLTLFFCLYLEIRKRKLDDMVEKVLSVSQATDVTMEVERERQAAAVRVCVELLDASAEHYENLVLLRDELRKREKMKRQFPPAIEPSSTM